MKIWLSDDPEWQQNFCSKDGWNLLKSREITPFLWGDRNSGCVFLKRQKEDFAKIQRKRNKNQIF